MKVIGRDELRAAWAAWTPLLHAIDEGKVEPLPYPHGSRGPPQADVLVSKAGFVKNDSYVWQVASQFPCLMIVMLQSQLR